MTAALLLRHWKYVAIGLLVVIIGVQSWRLGNAKEALEETRTELADTRAEARAFAEGVAARSEEIIRRAAERNARIEREQTQITQEVSREYEARIADARRRAAALRLQPRATAANPGSGGNPATGLPAATGQPDGSAAEGRLSDSDALIATEQAIQLEELQNWIRRQVMVPR